MRRKKRDQAPVKELLVPDGQVHRRLWLTVLAIVIAIGAFAFGISQLVKAIRGDGESWVTVRSDRYGEGYGSDLYLQYDVSAGEGSTVQKKKQITAAYTELCTAAQDLFDAATEADGTGTLRWLNQHPNETVRVDAALYRALELLRQAGDRTVYLAPLRADYTNLFLAQTEEEAAQYDPLTNPEAVAFREAAMRYVSDADMVELRLNGDGTVCLYVAEAYQTWAAENGVEQFLDFLWLKNAFIVDYIADRLIAKGLTYGALSSYDGFARNLDARGGTFGQNMTDRVGGTVYTAVQLQYSGRMTVVTMRNYALYSPDRFFCRDMADGSTRTLYLDAGDGICKAATTTLLAAAKEQSCAEVALTLAPFYIANTPDPARLDACTEKGIDCYYIADRTVYYTAQTYLKPVTVYDDGSLRYQLRSIK